MAKRKKGSGSTSDRRGPGDRRGSGERRSPGVPAGPSDPIEYHGHLSANPHAPIDRERTGPLRPPRPPIGLPILANGRTALPAGNPCEGCDHCCRYVSIQIDTPRSKGDFENIRWYLLHKNVSVMIDWEGDWLIQFDTPCEWLVDGRCGHYELRPEICREYDPAECERYAGPAERVLLSTPDDLERYLAEKKAKRKPKAASAAGARGPSDR